MQSGSSSWSRRIRSAVHSDHTKLVLARDTTTQGCWYVRVGTHTDVVKEVWPRKHNYVCSEERTVMYCAVLLTMNGSESSSDFCAMKSCRCQIAHVGERRAVWNQWTGLANGLEYWNGLNCCKKPSSWYDIILESSYPISHFTNLLMPCLGIDPASKFCGSKATAYLTKRLELGYLYKSSPLFRHLHAVNIL